MFNPITGLPGIGSDFLSTPREILAANVQLAQYIPGLRTIGGAYSRDAGNTYVDVLRAGLLLGMSSSGSNDNKFRPSIIGVSTAAYADNDTTITVSAATATEIARLKALGGGGDLSLKFIGPPTAAGTVASTALTVTAVGSTTITVGDLNLNKVAGSFITPADGSETPITILGTKHGTKVTDVGGNSVDVLASELLLAGHVRTSNIVNYPTDTSLIAWLKAQLRTKCPAMTFDDDFS